MIDISKYTGFFHDGSIMNIDHIGNNMVISMESAEIDKEDIKDDIVLATDDRIRGKLHIEGIKNITISKKSFQGTLVKEYDCGTIFDFEITKNFIELSIDWVNFPPNPKINEFSVIKIEAKKIWWENIPDLKVSV